MSMAGKRKYPIWYVDWVRENVARYTTSEMAEVSRRELGLDISDKQMLNFKKNNGIPSVKLEHRKYVYALFTAEQEEWIRENVKGKSNTELAAMVNERYGMNITAKQISSWKKNHHITSGLTGHFYTRENPVKDPHFMRGRPSSSKAKYKKGHRPHNAVPVGTECKRDTSYWWVKVAEPNKWRQKHILLWEAANGPMPDGYCLRFLDGNKDHVSLDNLQLVSKRVNSVINNKHMASTDAELTKTGILIAEVMVMAAERKKELKKGKKK